MTSESRDHDPAFGPSVGPSLPSSTETASPRWINEPEGENRSAGPMGASKVETRKSPAETRNEKRVDGHVEVRLGGFHRGRSLASLPGSGRPRDS